MIYKRLLGECLLEKITINVVAKHAGVSKKTVSRVLNGEPNVSESTRKKVQEVFDELGYRPSPQARGLATNQSYLIGLVYDNPSKSYVYDVQTGALSICNQKGYHLLIHPAEYQNSDLVDNLTTLINDSRLDGLVLTPPFSDMHHLIELLDKSQLPYVRIAPTIMHDTSPSVISNDVEAAYEMTCYLVSLGHSKIGFIKGHPDHNVSEQRLEGYQKALTDNGIPIIPEYIKQGFFTFSSGEECGRKLLSLTEPPTAIFASNDYMAAAVLKVASQKNISVPHELSVVGFDNAPISSYIWPSLTTVKQPVEAMASQALTMLIETIQKKPLDNIQAQMEDELIVRDSTAPFRSSG